MSAKRMQNCCSFVTTIVALFLVFVLRSSASAQTDAEILLQLKDATQIPFTDWNAANVSRVCQWTRVSCNGNSRVNILRLGRASKFEPVVMRGRLPNVITQLTALEDFDVTLNDLVGELPQGMFQLPVIQALTVSQTGLTIRLPAALPPTLNRISLDDTNVIGTIPEANYVHFLFSDFTRTNIRCPLPPGVVQMFNNGTELHECRWHTTNLFVDENNMLCGQVPISRVTCEIYPWLHVAPYYPSDVISTVPQYRVQFDNHIVEFNNSEASIFATYTLPGGEVRPYRAEYVSLKMLPVSESYRNAIGQLKYNHNISSWNTFIRDSPTRVRANMTMVDGLIIEVMFDEVFIALENKKTIKFSIFMHNVNHQWRTQNLADIAANVHFVLNYRVPHSPPDGPPIQCLTINNAPSNPCRSAVLELDNSFNLQGIFTFNTTTKNTIMTYQYKLDGTIDDVPVTGFNAKVFLSRFPFPLPSALWLERHTAGNGNTSFDRMPFSEQSVLYPITFAFRPVARKFAYDPDVSITLLFNPGLVPATPEEQNIVSTGISVGAIIAIVVGCLVAIAGVTLFAVFVFPYMKARQEAAAVTQEMESQSSPQTSNWKAVRPSET